MSSHGYGPTFERARLLVLARDSHTCHWCGGYARTADHLVPRIEGGSDTVGNLVAACQPCNSRRSLEWVRARRRRRVVQLFGRENVKDGSEVAAGALARRLGEADPFFEHENAPMDP